MPQLRVADQRALRRQAGRAVRAIPFVRSRPCAACAPACQLTVGPHRVRGCCGQERRRPPGRFGFFGGRPTAPDAFRPRGQRRSDLAARAIPPQPAPAPDRDQNHSAPPRRWPPASVPCATIRSTPAAASPRVLRPCQLRRQPARHGCGRTPRDPVAAARARWRSANVVGEGTSSNG